MDEEKINQLKEQGAMTDNTRLEELMMQEITPEMEREFFGILKESQLYMPVTYSGNIFEGLENAKVGDVIETKEDIGFNINYLTDVEGRKAVPLFTSSEMMHKAGVNSSSYAMFMSDLADMLKQTDKYSLIAINPFTGHELNFPIEVLFDLFNEREKMMDALEVILKLLREKSVEIDGNYMYFVRSDEDFMKEEAIDGVFRPNIPFNVSSRKDFQKDKKYLNILLMPKDKKILYIGDVVGEDGYDIVVAPETEFHFREDQDEFTRVWECGAQPFYDE